MSRTAVFRSGILVLMFAWMGAFPPSAFAQDPGGAAALPPSPESAVEPEGFTTEPEGVERAVIFLDRHFGNPGRTAGFYADVFNMIPGAGWIAGGPGYRQWYRQDRVFVDASAAISWRGYKTAQGRIEFSSGPFSRFAVGSQLRVQDFTQIEFFGTGPETLETSRSEYRLKSTNLVGYATVRPAERLGINVQLGWFEPSILPRTGFFMRDRPDTRDVFRRDMVFALPDQPTFIHRDASVTFDGRDFPGHPTRGGLLRAAAANYSDRDAGVFSFTRYETEAAGFVPLAGSRAVVAARGWLVASATDDGQVVPFYLQPSLGGHNTLRSYADYRFHDRHLLVLNVETRIAMMTHVDIAAFFDAGNVAARVADLNLEKRSYGAGLRLHSRQQTFGRLDVARGAEGWRFVLRLTDPLNLGRVSHRTTPAPFVP